MTFSARLRLTQLHITNGENHVHLPQSVAATPRLQTKIEKSKGPNYFFLHLQINIKLQQLENNSPLVKHAA